MIKTPKNDMPNMRDYLQANDVTTGDQALDFAILYCEGMHDHGGTLDLPGIISFLRDLRAAYRLSDDAWRWYWRAGYQPWPVEEKL